MELSLFYLFHIAIIRRESPVNNNKFLTEYRPRTVRARSSHLRTLKFSPPVQFIIFYFERIVPCGHVTSFVKIAVYILHHRNIICSDILIIVKSSSIHRSMWQLRVRNGREEKTAITRMCARYVIRHPFVAGIYDEQATFTMALARSSLLIAWYNRASGAIVLARFECCRAGRRIFTHTFIFASKSDSIRLEVPFSPFS